VRYAERAGVKIIIPLFSAVVVSSQERPNNRRLALRSSKVAPVARALPENEVVRVEGRSALWSIRAVEVKVPRART
jgi:hypothetical protein